MKLVELLAVSWSAVRAHKLRSVLTALGIVMSVWTIVSVLSVILGLNEFVMGRILNLSPDVFIVDRLGIIMSRDEFFNAIKRKPITNRDIEALRALCESCGEIGAQIQGSLELASGNRRIPSTDVIGTTANFSILQNIDVEAGRYFTDTEEEHRSFVAIIGWQVRDELFPHVDPLGRTISIAGLPHRIIGTIRKQGTILGENPDLLVYVPLRTAEKYMGRSRSRDFGMTVLVKAAGGIEGLPRAQEEVIQVFRWIRATPIRGENPVAIIGSEQLEALWRGISLSTFAFVLVLSATSLVVGAIVVANIMLVSVVQRTREIGIRLALGARKRDVRRQFLVEALILAIAGGAAGSGLGIATAWLVEHQSPIPAAVRTWTMALAVGLAAVTGLLAGFFPARKAANLPPIEALRHE